MLFLSARNIASTHRIGGGFKFETMALAYTDSIPKLSDWNFPKTSLLASVGLQHDICWYEMIPVSRPCHQIFLSDDDRPMT